jgi:hypothetical protein
MNAPIWLGGYGAAAVLLAGAGVAKAARPANTARALRQLGLPASTSAVRAAATAELLVAASVLVVGGRWPAALLAASYLVFAAVVTLASRRGSPLSSCGCFGEVDAPPTVVHAMLNLCFAAMAASLLVGGRPPALVPGGAERVAAGDPLLGAVFVLLTLTIAYLAYLVMAVLPKTSAAARALPGHGVEARS